MRADGSLFITWSGFSFVKNEPPACKSMSKLASYPGSRLPRAWVRGYVKTLWLCKNITSSLMTVVLLSERRAVVILRPRSASTTLQTYLSEFLEQDKIKISDTNVILEKDFIVYGAKFKCHIHYKLHPKMR